MTTPPTQPGLFPESEGERARRIDAEILDLLMSRPGGRFGETLNPVEKAVLAAIRYRRGHEHAVKINEIQQTAKVNGRTIKNAVRRLRMSFGLPIGSWKHSERGGYFLCIAREDIAIWKRDLRAQFQAELEVFRAATSEDDTLDMVAQLRAEVQP